MSRYTTTDVKSISIFNLNKQLGLSEGVYFGKRTLTWSINGEQIGNINYIMSTQQNDSYFHLMYKTKGSWEDGSEYRSIDYKVPLEALKCNFGGNRWYFRCSLYRNGKYCNKRVGILYQVNDYFGCRKCADLTYESCNENKQFRFLSKIFADERRSDELRGKIDRTHYAGKPTKKYKRFLELSGRYDERAHLMLESMLKKR